MELVTEPVIHSASEAGKFARELQMTLRYLGVSDANMEKGEMRVEANISVSDTDKFGTKVEVKNLNSFKSVERAIEYELKRQIDLIESGEKVIQETRGWDDGKQQTYSQRMKEESHDYRYFPDPDLPKLKISEISELSTEVLKNTMPELPWEVRERLKKDFGANITEDTKEIFVRVIPLCDYLDATFSELKHDAKFSKTLINYITSDLIGLMKKDFSDSWEDKFSGVVSKIPAKNFAELVRLVSQGKLSSRGAKDVLAIIYKYGGEPNDVADKNGLIQKSDEGALKEIVKNVLSANEKVAADYKAGKEASLQFLIGQGMKATKGSANPEMLSKIIKELI